MTRAQPWEFAAVGLQLEMFSTVLIFRPDDEMPGKHGKIANIGRFSAIKNIVDSTRSEFQLATTERVPLKVIL